MVAPRDGSELRANALVVLAALFVVGIGAACLLALAIYFPRQNRLAATHLPRSCCPRGAEREARRWACRATMDALAAPRTRHAFDEILTELTSEACFHGDERAVAYAERVLETFPDTARWAPASTLAEGSAAARLARATYLDLVPPSDSPTCYLRTADLSNVTELQVEGPYYHDKRTVELLQKTSISGIRVLRLEHMLLDPDDVQALIHAPLAPRLEELRMAMVDLNPEEARLLATAKFPRLELLAVEFDDVGAEAAGAFARAFPALKELDLRGDGLEADAVSAILAGPPGRLAHVDLAFNPIGNASASLPPPLVSPVDPPFVFGPPAGAASSRASPPVPDDLPSEIHWMSVAFASGRFDAPTFMRPTDQREARDIRCSERTTKFDVDGRMPRATCVMLSARSLSVAYLTSDVEGCLDETPDPDRRRMVVGGRAVEVGRDIHGMLIVRPSPRRRDRDHPCFLGSKFIFPRSTRPGDGRSPSGSSPPGPSPDARARAPIESAERHPWLLSERAIVPPGTRADGGLGGELGGRRG